MTTLLDLPATPAWANGTAGIALISKHRNEEAWRDARYSESLRLCAWNIGAQRATDGFTPAENHVGLAHVSPCQAFAHWRIREQWIDERIRERGPAWNNCRLVIRLYDVSLIEFTGLNAHQLQDHTLPSVCGQMFCKLSKPGTWQLAEVGFLLRSGEFVPAARSSVAAFAPSAALANSSQAALLVNGRGHIEEISNLWDQERILRERRRPRLRRSLRLASFAYGAMHTGAAGCTAQFVSELAAGQALQGHEVHVFVPAGDELRAHRQVGDVHYHPLEVNLEGSPLEVAARFGRAAAKRLDEFPPFDAMHLHEWMTGMVPERELCPRVLSLTSTEASRRQSIPATDLSLAIEAAERKLAHATPLVLTPAWLRGQAHQTLGINGDRLRAFPMEGRMPNDWETPLDPGHVKMGIGLGPLDRLLIFIGPLEHAAGVDVLLEALPTLLQRAGNARLVYVGEGGMRGGLEGRAQQMGVANAVRFLGHVEGPALCKLLRSSLALVLPSRYRVPFDDAVVDLARRAARPVVTTHGGPAHLIRHEDNGIVTYDNPGSMVWALDRIMGDPSHADRMGHNGRRTEDTAITWPDVARHYMDLCAATYPELREKNG